MVVIYHMCIYCLMYLCFLSTVLSGKPVDTVCPKAITSAFKLNTCTNSHVQTWVARCYKQKCALEVARLKWECSCLKWNAVRPVVKQCGSAVRTHETLESLLQHRQWGTEEVGISLLQVVTPFIICKVNALLWKDTLSLNVLCLYSYLYSKYKAASLFSQW